MYVFVVFCKVCKNINCELLSFRRCFYTLYVVFVNYYHLG
nr:MAG TPA: hypothetical protein [Bacteriophage sp.]